MRGTTHPKGIQMPTSTTTAGGENRRKAHGRHLIEVVLWVVGLIVFTLSCFFVHAHPAPFPIDLSMTLFAQHAHLWPWVNSSLEVPSELNNPVPSLVALGTWCAFMLLMALIFWLRGKSPLTWLQNAIFFLVTVLGASGINGALAILIGRPRPDPHRYPIHVYTPIVPFPTYPSGHTEHDVVFYGFLLYLSFTRPVREWRYRWFLLPLQLYAVFDILAIGYSRVLEGDHWFTDVLGGYLEGAIELFLFIFLYRWVTNLLARRREKHAAA